MRRAALVILLLTTTGRAQAPDMILVNGTIISIDEASSIHEALAIHDNRIVAVGTTAQVQGLAGDGTEIIDLDGRSVIPGLIDSHMHAIRAARSFATEVNWIGASSIGEAIERISDKAAQVGPETWLIVAGGWNAQQFEENRRPTQTELIAAAPRNPVYV